MNTADITTVVVNWNLINETTRCLESLASSDLSCHTIVVDNGSQQDPTAWVQARFPHVEIISLPQNVGFSRACNQGIKQALQSTGCEYIFLLNNDASVHPAALGSLINAAQTLPRAGILGPKVYYRQPARKIWYAGARRRRGVLAAVATGRGAMDQGQFKSVAPVDYIFGAAMFIRRQVFEQIGYFDERFFLYLEDLDFCLRAQAAGLDLYYIPQACVWHTGSASTAGDPVLQRQHLVRSTILFLRKHRSLVSPAPAVLFWAAVSLRMLLGDLIRGDLRLVSAYWSALVSDFKPDIS